MIGQSRIGIFTCVGHSANILCLNSINTIVQVEKNVTYVSKSKGNPYGLYVKLLLTVSCFRVLLLT
jgi:hypothetical protein